MADSASESPAKVLGALVAGTAFKYVSGLWSGWSKDRTFEKVGTVSALYVYPVKSFRGLKVQEAECTKYGLKSCGVSDRTWAVATSDGVYLTQRQVPTMALIEPSIQGDQLHLDAPGMKTLVIPVNPVITPDRISKITVKADTVESLDCGDEAAKWLCQYFKRDGLRLHFSAPTMEKRDVSKAKKLWENPALPGDMTSLSDYCGFMVLSDASLDALNERLDTPVPINNFRANIVVGDCAAFAEDNWKEIRIGSARLRTLDACTRCLMVTVDQFKGVKHPKEEPLATLKKFRLRDPYGPKPAFGVDATLEDLGAIRVGDPVFAIKE